MSPRTVDLIAGGPPVADPYDPGASAWALAEGFARAGHSVRVLYPGNGGESAGPDPSLPAAPFDGGAGPPGSLEAARAASRALRPDAEVVVRDPMGFGTIDHARRSGGPSVLGVVRAAPSLFLGLEPPGPERPGLLGRWGAWSARRAHRRLGRSAVDALDRLYADTPELGARLESEYGVDAARALATSAPVGRGSPPPSRAEARRALTVPDDVPVIVLLAPSPRADAPELAKVREAFVGLRPIFPGVRLVALGVSSFAGPGISTAPRRDGAAFASALLAADLAVLPGPTLGIDPGLVLALRAGVAAVALARGPLPADLAAAVRSVPSDDARDLASTLTELLADPGARAELAQAGPPVARRFDPEEVANSLLGDGAR